MGFRLAVKSCSQEPDLELLDALTRLKAWLYQETDTIVKLPQSEYITSALIDEGTSTLVVTITIADDQEIIKSFALLSQKATDAIKNSYLPNQIIDYSLTPDKTRVITFDEEHVLRLWDAELVNL
jgi:phage-related protein